MIPAYEADCTIMQLGRNLNRSNQSAPRGPYTQRPAVPSTVSIADVFFAWNRPPPDTIQWSLSEAQHCSLTPLTRQHGSDCLV